MPILLFTDVDACTQTVCDLGGVAVQQPAILLHQGTSALLAPLQVALPELVGVDVASPRFARLNFDSIGILILDLAPDFLLTSGGRRLLDALGKLAEESLALAFVGEAVSVVGGALLDGVYAGLSLVPDTAVVPDLRGVGDLRTLLGALSARGTRLLALDAPVGVGYVMHPERIRVKGAGSAMLATFRSDRDDEPTAARLHVLTDGMESSWPT